MSSGGLKLPEYVQERMKRHEEFMARWNTRIPEQRRAQLEKADEFRVRSEQADELAARQRAVKRDFEAFVSEPCSRVMDSRSGPIPNAAEFIRGDFEHYRTGGSRLKWYPGPVGLVDLVKVISGVHEGTYQTAFPDVEERFGPEKFNPAEFAERMAIGEGYQLVQRGVVLAFAVRHGSIVQPPVEWFSGSLEKLRDYSLLAFLWAETACEMIQPVTQEARISSAPSSANGQATLAAIEERRNENLLRAALGDEPLNLTPNDIPRAAVVKARLRRAMKDHPLFADLGDTLRGLGLKDGAGATPTPTRQTDVSMPSQVSGKTSSQDRFPLAGKGTWKKYDHDFIVEGVKMVMVSGISANAAGLRLVDIHESEVPRNWRLENGTIRAANADAAARRMSDKIRIALKLLGNLKKT